MLLITDKKVTTRVYLNTPSNTVSGFGSVRFGFFLCGSAKITGRCCLAEQVICDQDDAEGGPQLFWLIGPLLMGIRSFPFRTSSCT